MSKKVYINQFQSRKTIVGCQQIHETKKYLTRVIKEKKGFNKHHLQERKSCCIGIERNDRKQYGNGTLDASR